MRELTDNDIIRTLELIAKEQNSNFLITVIEFINRQKAEIEALINGQETLQKHIADKNAEIERKGKILNSYALQYGTVTDQSKKIKEIKSETYKEFAERLKDKSMFLEDDERYVGDVVKIKEIDNTLKELTEVKDGE